MDSLRRNIRAIGYLLLAGGLYVGAFWGAGGLTGALIGVMPTWIGLFFVVSAAVRILFAISLWYYSETARVGTMIWLLVEMAVGLVTWMITQPAPFGTAGLVLLGVVSCYILVLLGNERTRELFVQAAHPNQPT